MISLDPIVASEEADDQEEGFMSAETEHGDSKDDERTLDEIIEAYSE